MDILIIQGLISHIASLFMFLREIELWLQKKYQNLMFRSNC